VRRRTGVAARDGGPPTDTRGTDDRQPGWGRRTSSVGFSRETLDD